MGQSPYTNNVSDVTISSHFTHKVGDRQAHNGQLQNLVHIHFPLVVDFGIWHLVFERIEFVE